MKRLSNWIVCAVIGLGVMPAVSTAGLIVNVDATLYGYTGADTYTQPAVGTLVNPISLAPGGTLDQVTFGPGVYTITNATGLPGANPNFTAWRYDGGSQDWAYIFVLVDDSTDRVIGGVDEGTYSSQAAAAANSNVQNFSEVLTLTNTTTVDFMIRDYYLPDNAGGVALNIQPTGVPEPSSLVLCGLSATIGLVAARVRRKGAAGRRPQ